MGWLSYRRVPESGACPFCLILASRGAVYRSAETAGVAHDYHPHCRCGVEAEADYDAIWDTAIAPEDANRVVSMWNRPRSQGGHRYTYDLADRGRPMRPPAGQKPVRPIQPRVTDPHGRPAGRAGGGSGTTPPGAAGGFGDDFDLLDEDFRDWAEALSQRQRDAFLEWQKTSRFYETVQNYLRGTGPPPDPETLLLIEALVEGVRAGALKRDLVLYRGLRNWTKWLGLNLPAKGEVVRLKGLASASILRGVAEAEFMVPGAKPALVILDARAGTRAAWVAGVGDPSLRRQGELLLPARTPLRVTHDIGYDHHRRPIIRVKVLRP